MQRDRRCGHGSKRTPLGTTGFGLFFLFSNRFLKIFIGKRKASKMPDLTVVLQSVRWLPGFTPVVIKCSVGFTQLFLRLVSLLLSFVWATLLLIDSPSPVYLGLTRPYTDHSHHSIPCTRTSKGQEGSGHFASSSRYPFLTPKPCVLKADLTMGHNSGTPVNIQRNLQKRLQ